MHKEHGTTSLAHFRLLSDAMDEFCSARTQEEVVQISALLARRACDVDSISVVLAAGDQFHYAPGREPDVTSRTLRSKVIARMSAWAIETAQTAVVPDVHRDDRTSSHTNGSTFARSLVVVPVGGRPPIATVTAAWVQEHWPSADDVLVIETLARAAGLALTCRPAHALPEVDDPSPVNDWLGMTVAAEGLRGAERRHRITVAELQHRVRNALALVRSLVRPSARPGDLAEDYAALLEGRISSVSRTQGLVMRSAHAGVGLEELVDAELTSHTARSERIRVSGPPVHLKAKAAETLGLALHELAANAAKFGALAAEGGELRITWRREIGAVPCIRFDWVERGVPLSNVTTPRRGFGWELIERTVPYELRGSARLTLGDDGIRCTIHIPLTADNVVADA